MEFWIKHLREMYQQLCIIIIMIFTRDLATS